MTSTRFKESGFAHPRHQWWCVFHPPILDVFQISHISKFKRIHMAWFYFIISSLFFNQGSLCFIPNWLAHLPRLLQHFAFIGFGPFFTFINCTNLLQWFSISKSLIRDFQSNWQDFVIQLLHLFSSQDPTQSSQVPPHHEFMDCPLFTMSNHFGTARDHPQNVSANWWA